MSSHGIYVICSTDGCSTSAILYTGDSILDGFEQDQWEGEIIKVPCDDHLGGGS